MSKVTIPALITAATSPRRASALQPFAGAPPLLLTKNDWWWWRHGLEATPCDVEEIRKGTSL
ncbi:MAG: hypothetical protein K2W95_11040 [Candidatus Obscuribacterales bacterium]|nr:hypothetical protein [Candidatus Obscuribacterales bacterium]